LLISQGLSNERIADKLDITVITVLLCFEKFVKSLLVGAGKLKYFDPG